MTRPWLDARKLLVVRVDNLGDVLMTTPAIAAIKHTSPSAKITLLASEAGAAALRHVPALDDAIVCNPPWTKGTSGGAGRSAHADRRLVNELARREFDAAIIFTVCTQSALPAAMACRLGGIPLRLAHCRENPYDLLTDWVQDTEVCATGMRHEVTRQLDLVKSVGFEGCDERMQFRYPATDVLSMRRKFMKAGGDLLRPYLVVHPGATAASRRYPAERFGTAAQAVVDETGCQVVFTGGTDEEPLIAQAQRHMQDPGVSLAGQITLGELAALIAGAQVIVCNNSGPVHIAAAVGTPVAVLYALTNPQHTPWRVPSHVLNRDVPCRNCLKSVCPERHHPCLLGVDAQTVALAALDLIRPLPGVPLSPHTHSPVAPLMALG
ncbi:glycosyltransferase family 9 protein [Piscinibacter sp.]|uniref:glycosyltransferase family 9 protein n=1 Tax=Piscinibacter sp. TaxID=1903157 RepID=UPI002BFD84F6|nr:glycosyltransferase family 9 protein [Albitalea sp.]HUG25283.1 glycosyltransferase family 9 protein [Albitalea sp.]